MPTRRVSSPYPENPILGVTLVHTLGPAADRPRPPARDAIVTAEKVPVSSVDATILDLSISTVAPSLRNEVDLADLTGDLAEVVKDTLQPSTEQHSFRRGSGS